MTISPVDYIPQSAGSSPGAEMLPVPFDFGFA